MVDSERADRLIVELRMVRPNLASFGREYYPGHPTADDANGHVLLPNVNGIVEAFDMKEAMRAYEANLNVIETRDAMEKSTLSLLDKT